MGEFPEDGDGALDGTEPAVVLHPRRQHSRAYDEWARNKDSSKSLNSAIVAGFAIHVLT